LNFITSYYNPIFLLTKYTSDNIINILLASSNDINKCNKNNNNKNNNKVHDR